MKNPYFLLVPFPLLVTHAYASQPDPLSNLRPTNITGLAYYLYRWTGSYYNGTTTIRIEPQAFDEAVSCTFDKVVELTYPESLLAIVKSNLHGEEPNPLDFALKFWEPGLNITPAGDNDMGPIDDIETFESVELNLYDKPSYTEDPPWKLNSTSAPGSGAFYYFQGYHNSSLAPLGLAFNYTHCGSDKPALYGGSIVKFDPEEEQVRLPNLRFTGPPTVRGGFNALSASIEIKGVFKAWSTEEGPNGEQSALGGPISIVFEGRIDDMRSDELIGNANGTPVWNPTMGYTKDLSGEVNRGAATLVNAGSLAIGLLVSTALVMM